MICTNCYYRGEGKTVTQGSFAIELVLWIFFFWAFLIPPLIYSIWRLTTRTKACPKCGGQATLIPEDSPRGAELAKKHSLKGDVGNVDNKDNKATLQSPSNIENPSKKATGKAWMLLLVPPILVIFVLIPNLFANNSDTQKKVDSKLNVISSPSPTIAHREDFKVSVNFTGTQFVIANLDNLDCENAIMEINGGLFSGGYALKGYILKAGEIYTVGALQFTKDDGTRLNPYQIKPKTFSIYCSSIGSTNALGGAGWYGEFK